MGIIIQCAWCKKVLGVKEGTSSKGALPGNITHSICPSCASAISDEIPQLTAKVFAPPAVLYHRA